MFNRILHFVVFSLLLLVSNLTMALSVEAEGQALILNNDLGAARKAAIKSASQQASMQAAVYVSSTQQVRDGILAIDDMKITTLGQVENIKILSERITDNFLRVRIKADVIIDGGCGHGTRNNYLKSVAVAAFPLLHPAQANTGALGDSPRELPNRLATRLAAGDKVHPLKATHLNLYASLQNAASRQLDDGTLTSVAANINHLDTQFIISGVIRDMAMIDPRTHAENNYFIDLYNRLDYRSRKHLRNFEVDLFLHDGFSGALLMERRYQTQGIWNLPGHLKAGFNSQAFANQEYGQAVIKLIDQLSTELEQDLRCRPFSARITRTENNQIWFNADINSGIKAGDKFNILHRSTFYNSQMRPTHQLSNTRRTLVVDEVQPNFVKGHLVNIARQQNILPGDIVTSH
ncbi:MAG: flagellar assembly protein T N-terminal domain-containing protein [Pontibacterium sp.]